MQLNERQQEILTHSLGLKTKMVPHRNLFVALSGGKDSEFLTDLLEQKLIQPHKTNNNENSKKEVGFASVYEVTELGKEIILDILKKQREISDGTI